MDRSVSVMVFACLFPGIVQFSCNDAAGGCRYDTDCPGVEICIDGKCVPNRCPDIPCESNETCVNGKCYPSDSLGTRTFTAGGEFLSSENYRFELFIAPVCPTGDLQSQNHRLKLGPAAYAAPEP